jgi:helix-turn-helix protein
MQTRYRQNSHGSKRRYRIGFLGEHPAKPCDRLADFGRFVCMRSITYSVDEISPYLGVGVYRLADAARLAEVPTARDRGWVRGYPSVRAADGGPVKRRRPLLGSRLPEAPEPLVSFADLIELRFVAHFRKAGLSWSRISKAVPMLREVFREAPDGDVVFESDGVKLFADTLAKDGSRNALDLVEHNYVMLAVLRDSFKEELRLDGKGVVTLWHPRKELPNVLLDPNRQFGQPIVEPGIPTAVLASDFRRRSGDVYEVGRRYGITPPTVLQAVRFEQTLLAPAG